MALISSMRRQVAIYWPPASANDYGETGFRPLVELVLAGKNYRVRWEDRVEEFVDVTGTLQKSRAVVYVPRLPDGSEVAPGGYLWLGARGDLVSETVPADNAGAGVIKRFDMLPTLKANDFLRTVYL